MQALWTEFIWGISIIVSRFTTQVQDYFITIDILLLSNSKFENIQIPDFVYVISIFLYSYWTWNWNYGTLPYCKIVRYLSKNNNTTILSLNVCHIHYRWHWRKVISFCMCQTLYYWILQSTASFKVKSKTRNLLIIENAHSCFHLGKYQVLRWMIFQCIQ